MIYIISWLCLTELSYFGTSATRYLYNQTFRFYDTKWQNCYSYAPELVHRLFVTPVVSRFPLSGHTEVLDLACGTGQLATILLSDPTFLGSIHCVDNSSEMLNLLRVRARLFDQHTASRLSTSLEDLCKWRCTGRESYDVILLLEVSELIPRLDSLFSQISMSLSIGGLLITTRVTAKYTVFFPWRSQRQTAFEKLLSRHGLRVLATHSWHNRYDVVYAQKDGQ